MSNLTYSTTQLEAHAVSHIYKNGTYESVNVFANGEAEVFTYSATHGATRRSVHDTITDHQEFAADDPMAKIMLVKAEWMALGRCPTARELFESCLRWGADHRLAQCHITHTLHIVEG